LWGSAHLRRSSSCFLSSQDLPPLPLQSVRITEVEQDAALEEDQEEAEAPLQGILKQGGGTGEGEKKSVRFEDEVPSEPEPIPDSAAACTSTPAQPPAEQEPAQQLTRGYRSDLLRALDKEGTPTKSIQHLYSPASRGGAAD